MDQIPDSHLFTLRVWSEVDEDGRARWRGKLRYIPADTIYYFRDWAALVPLILAALRAQQTPDPDSINNEDLN